MENNKIVDALNKLLSWELAGGIQYSQHSYLVHGLWRETYKGFFRERAEECRKHAQVLGEKIVALGGLPTVEPAPIKQSRDLEEMLNQDLELEKTALAAYMDTLKLVQDNVALRVMMETFVEDETRGVEEIEKCLSLKTVKMKDKEIRLKA